MQILGFEFYPSILIGCVYLVGGYLLATGPLRRRHGWSEQGPGLRRQVAFFAGVGLMFLSLNGPLHRLSDDYLFSAHMVQHMLVMMLMPPLLIGGIPPWLIRAALRVGWVRIAARVLTHPVVAFVAYNAVFIGWHFPQFYNWALINHDAHILQHLMFMAVAVMMWWPVMNPVRELEVIPTGPLLILYIFVFGIPATAISAFLTLSDRVFYPWYALAPRIAGLSALDDQRLGGLIMWVPGMLIFWIAMTIVYFRWTRDEYRGWGRFLSRTGRGATAAALAALLVPGTGLAAQAGAPEDPAGTRSAEGELGASVFFGNTEQITLTHRASVGMAGPRIEATLSWDVTYGETTDEAGMTLVSRRDWSVATAVDYAPRARFSPFVLATLESSLQKRVNARIAGGGGAKWTPLRSERGRLDASLAALVERTEPRGAGPSELLGRWSARVRGERNWDEGRVQFSTVNLWVPALRDIRDYTLRSTHSLAFALNSRVALKASLVESWDTGARDRGARTNRDGQLFFSILARL